MKHQKISRNIPPKRPIIENEKTPTLTTIQNFNPATANLPIRTVNYVEVYDMSAERVLRLLQELGKAHDPEKGGIQYFVPMRHGQIRSDLSFEAEFLAVVKEMCEVKDGEIQLKGGAQDVHIIRQKI